MSDHPSVEKWDQFLDGQLASAECQTPETLMRTRLPSRSNEIDQATTMNALGWSCLPSLTADRSRRPLRAAAAHLTPFAAAALVHRLGAHVVPPNAHTRRDEELAADPGMRVLLAWRFLSKALAPIIRWPWAGDWLEVASQPGVAAGPQDEPGGNQHRGEDSARSIATRSIGLSYHRATEVALCPFPDVAVVARVPLRLHAGTRFSRSAASATFAPRLPPRSHSAPALSLSLLSHGRKSCAE